jgi:hypothetical protein
MTLNIEAEGKALTYNDIDDPFFIELFPKIKDYTITAMIGAEGPWALYKSIEYIVKNNIPGDIVECGVWRGGSMILAAMTLIKLGDTSRKLYLYDTFRGMPRPGEIDKGWNGTPALPIWQSYESQGLLWGFGGTVDMVRDTLRTTNYPEDNIVFVEGMVENTLPGTRPEQISILRLDTDLYKSTYHELVHLYPLLASGGILIIDDYGFTQGCRIATDQYIQENNLKIFLSRIDGHVRLAVKP